MGKVVHVTHRVLTQIQRRKWQNKDIVMHNNKKILGLICEQVDNYFWQERLNFKVSLGEWAKIYKILKHNVYVMLIGLSTPDSNLWKWNIRCIQLLDYFGLLALWISVQFIPWCMVVNKHMELLSWSVTHQHSSHPFLQKTAGLPWYCSISQKARNLGSTFCQHLRVVLMLIQSFATLCAQFN